VNPDHETRRLRRDLSDTPRPPRSSRLFVFGQRGERTDHTTKSCGSNVSFFSAAMAWFTLSTVTAVANADSPGQFSSVPLVIALMKFSLDHEYCSHILLIPFISAFLIYMNRDAIKKSLSWWPGGALLIIPAIPVFIWAIARKSTLAPNDFLSVATFSIICIWIAGFAVCLGTRVARAAMFPLSLLLLMIPLPSVALDAAIRFLQQGSTTITWWLLQAVGEPSLRDGFMIHLPKFTILVAEECSGIRSSTALLITTLLVAQLLLRSKWRKLALCVAVVPLAMFKNGLRIATLSVLSVYVSRDFLYGWLHHSGGVVFFLIGLSLICGILRLLHLGESRFALKKGTVASVNGSASEART